MKNLLTAFLLLLFSAASTAQTTACLEHFANKAAPELTRPALQKQTIGLCFEAFALMYSGVSRTPLWVAEKLTRESLIRARSVQREDNFHAEETLPPEDRAEGRAGAGFLRVGPGAAWRARAGQSVRDRVARPDQRLGVGGLSGR